MFYRQMLAVLAVTVVMALPAAFAVAQEDDGSQTQMGEPVRPELAPIDTPPTTDGGSPVTGKHDHAMSNQPDDGAGATIPHLTTFDFLNKVGNSTQPVLVQFDAHWCPFCKKLQPMLDRLRQKKLGVLEIYKVDADDEQELMRSYEVGTLPTLIMFYDGRIVGRSDGGLSEAELADWVSAVEDDIRASKRHQPEPTPL